MGLWSRATSGQPHSVSIPNIYGWPTNENPVTSQHRSLSGAIVSIEVTLIGVAVLALLLGVGAWFVLRGRRASLPESKAVSAQDIDATCRALAEQVGHGVLLYRIPSGEIQAANAILQQMTHNSEAQLKRQRVSDLFIPAEGGETRSLASLSAAADFRDLELLLLGAKEAARPVAVTQIQVALVNPELRALLVRDMSVTRKAESKAIERQKELDQRAHHDELTGLPNRAYLHAQLPKALERAAAEKSMLAVLFIDLDRFKHVNDTLGHEAGDKLLKEIATRLRSAVRPDDAVVRMGGDEFVVMLKTAKTQEEINAAAGRINTVLGAPVVIDGRAVVATASIGISTFPRDGATMGELLRHSDTAMYQAKDSGRNNFQTFSPLMDQQIKRRVAIETSLRAGIKLKQFDVFYQPIIEIASRRVTGMEALLRWRHPVQGYIPPLSFLEVAEETGLILQLGEYVLERVVSDIAEWRRRNLFVIPVAINISAVQLERTKLHEVVREVLRVHQVEPELLQIELTEGSLFEKRTGEFRVDALEALRDLGVKIAIDDFGTGYSSLQYLKRWRVDALKIDRGFVSDLVTDPSDFAIVNAIVAMARSLNIKVVAEGIEGWQQLEILSRMGCHQAQGNLFAQPVPGTEAVRFLKPRSAGVHSSETQQVLRIADVG